MKDLKLYLIRQFENRGYDTFDSAVVVAESEDEARKILPASWSGDRSWARPEYVHVEYIGELNPETGYKQGDVVISSFNAG